jgi:hypothetical protein
MFNSFFQDQELSIDEAVSQLNHMGITQPMLFKAQHRFWIKADNTAIQIVSNSCFDDCVELLFFCFFLFLMYLTLMNLKLFTACSNAC